MALPEQIRKQDEAVQELYKQINGEVEEQPELVAAQPSADDTQNYADDQPVEESAVPSPAKADDERVPEETVLQKYKTLQGMYNAEVPRLHQQNRELNQRLQQLEQLLASVSTQQKESSRASAPVVAKLVTDADIEEYGDSIDMMRKVSREEVGSVASRLSKIEEALNSLQSSVVPQIQEVSKRQAASSEQQFWSDLSNAVPNWRDINDDQDFQSWLLEVDQLTGISRQTYLEDAQRQLDSRRVANFFSTWMNITGRAAVAQSADRSPKPQSELEKQVTPGRSRNTGTPANSKGKVWSAADITKFFDDVRTGKYHGREQERDRTERDIFAAQRENRIQSNA